MLIFSSCLNASDFENMVHLKRKNKPEQNYLLFFSALPILIDWVIYLACDFKAESYANFV